MAKFFPKWLASDMESWEEAGQIHHAFSYKECVAYFINPELNAYGRDAIKAQAESRGYQVKMKTPDLMLIAPRDENPKTLMEFGWD